jgi:hypothetical protein
MSGRKLWLASDKLNPSVLDPNGKITRDSDGNSLEADSLPEGIAQTSAMSLRELAPSALFRNPTDWLGCFRVRKNLKGHSTGDPTEVALQVFSMKLGLGRPALTDDSVIPEENRGRPALGVVIEEISRDSGVTEEKREKVRFEGVEEEAEVPKEKRFDLKIEFPFSSEIGQAVVLIRGAVRCCVRHLVGMLTI